VGDEVIIKEDGQLCTVTRLGSNYIIVESSGKSYRKWLDSVEKVEPAYHKSKELWSKAPRPNDWGTNASDKEARRKTPGQKGKNENTNSRKTTLAFKDFDEGAAEDRAKNRIELEKKRDARKHDRALDRARTRDTFSKNKETIR